MASIKRALLGLLLAGAAMPAFAAPLDAYGKLPAVEGVEISPDGARLAIIVTDGEKRAVQIQTVADHKIERVLPAGEAKLRGLMWVDPTHLVVLRSTTAELTGFTVSKQEIGMGFEYDVVGNTAHAIMGGTPDATNTFSQPQIRVVDGKPALFVHSEHFHERHGSPAIYRIDPDRGFGTLVDVGTEDADSLLLGPDGHALAETTWNELNKRWTLKLRAGAGWRQVREETTSVDVPNIVGLGRDGKSILVAEQKDGKQIIRELSPDGAWSGPLAIPEVAGGLIFDPLRHNLIGYSGLAGDQEKTVFLDPKDQQVWDLVQHAYPGQLVKLVSWSDDRKKIVVFADSPTEGPGYALVDLQSHHADWISNQYDKIGPNDLSPRTAISFKAADGTELTGYLTVPKGKAAKDLPLVVLPHGGPQARDEPGFDWLAQGIASRGYAVLQVNFRGSDGFGMKFVEAGYGEWGRKMQTDLSDGVRYLAKQGAIDPKRVCIVGASYGGYAALAGPTIDPGVYRCAVSYAGISDMHTFVPWVESQTGDRAERYVMRYLGAKDKGDPVLSQVSPAAHVDKVDVPILLIHGKDDTTVPLEQSRIMVNDMKAAGKPVDFVVLDSTDHWLTRGSTRIAMLKATMDFVEKNNPPN